MRVPTQPSRGEDGAFGWSLPLFQPQDGSLSFCRQKVLELVQLRGEDRTLSAPLSWKSWAERCLPITEGKKIMSHY